MDNINKECKTCLVTKDYSEFPWGNKVKGIKKSYCKSCYRLKSRENYNIKYADKVKVTSEKKVIRAIKEANRVPRVKLTKEEQKIKRAKYIKDKRKSNPLFKAKGNIRTLISNSITKFGYSKKSRTHQILGCDLDEMVKYIENQFEDWMSWDNYGNPNSGGVVQRNKTWDLDHIICLSTAKTEEDIVNLNHYTNFQPLCSYVNRYVKRNK